MELWTPTREWEGGSAYLIGGGPSLKDFDFSLLIGKNVIGCNDAWHLGAHIVSICLFGDPSWWHRNKWKLKDFKGRLVTNAPGVLPFEIPNLLKMNRLRDGIHNGSTLGWNYSTGAAAINLAISLGATQVFLLGYDLGNRVNVSHWHTHSPTTTIQEYAFQRFLRGFYCVKRSLPPSVQVFNVTDGSSRLDCFDKISFEHFRELLTSAAESE